MGYTPGPWKTCTTGEVTTRQEDGKPWRRIAFVQDWGGGSVDEVDKANAKLIAAAPDMLTCIEDFCAAYVPADGSEMSFDTLNRVFQTALRILNRIHAEVESDGKSN